MKRLGLLGLVLLALAACDETSTADVAGEWTLVSGTGPSGEIPTNNPITFEIDRKDGFGGGEGPCNHYGGVVLKDGTIRPDETNGLISTALACAADIEEAETRYYEALNAATEFELDGDQLVLTGSDVELRFERS